MPTNLHCLAVPHTINYVENIFLDCGFHLGEGLSQFIDILNISHENWLIYTFEANPFCEMSKKIYKFKPIKIIPCEVAVWVNDGKVLFNCENQNASNSPKNNSTHINDGWGSVISELNSAHTFSTQISVKTIDFSKFVTNLNTENIFCKMDIEGAEFPVLRKMINDRTISKIKKIWVEWHDVDIPTECLESRLQLIKDLKKHTEVVDWR
jgi:FkbM family methyltransferase